MTSSPSLHAQAATTSNSPAAFFSALGNAGTPGAISNAAPSPGSALLASLSGTQQLQASMTTPGAPSPSLGLFLGRQQNHPSPGQYAGTPVSQPALKQQHLQAGLIQQHQQLQQGGSVAGSAVTHSAGGTTSADAPNEARRLLRALLDEQGQGRLSLARIANEVNTLVQDVNNAFTTVPAVNPAARLADLLACLDELHTHLARTGLGALPIAGESVDYSNIQAMIANMAQEVQGKFKHRQRIREGAGVAKSVFK